MDKWTAYCQNILNNSNWYPWVFEAVPQGILCTGAVCPLVSRGKRKGEPNYRKADRSTQTSIICPATYGGTHETGT